MTKIAKRIKDLSIYDLEQYLQKKRTKPLSLTQINTIKNLIIEKEKKLDKTVKKWENSWIFEKAENILIKAGHGEEIRTSGGYKTYEVPFKKIIKAVIELGKYYERQSTRI